MLIPSLSSFPSIHLFQVSPRKKSRQKKKKKKQTNEQTKQNKAEQVIVCLVLSWKILLGINIAQMTSTSKAYNPCLLFIIIK